MGQPQQQQKNQGGKGNPASTRMSNPARKVRRSLSWQRGERRKAARVAAQEARAAANVKRREAHVPTLWEAAKASRRHRRAAA